MAYRIRLVQSGHEFEAEPTETILEAALRHGINLPYRCSNGTCGQCVARVVAGNLSDSRFHDYVIGEAEKGQGYTLMCSSRALSDAAIEIVEALAAEDVPYQSIEARVAHLERLDEQYLILHLRTPRTRTLRFLAGQAVRLGIRGFPRRKFAVASCPCNGLVLQFHIRERPGDPLISHITKELRISDPVTVEGPFGDFTLDEQSDRPIALLALDTGFAPIKSLIEHAIALELSQPVMLFWLVEPGGKHYMENYCRSWADAIDNFSFQALRLSRTDELGPAMENIIRTVGETGLYDFFVSGTPEFVETARDALQKGNYPRRRIKVFAH